MKKVMVVAAHPDDAEFGMGGTIAKMASAGFEVVVVDLSDGEPTPFGSRAVRQAESKKASEILGVSERLCLGMANRYIEATAENRRKLAEVIRLHRPDVLFGPVGVDYHPDHVQANMLVSGSRFEAKYHKTDMAGEPHWVGRCYRYYSVHRGFCEGVSFIVDVTEFWGRKIEAVLAYASQLRSVCGGEVCEKIEAMGRYFGQCAGCMYGEAFLSDEPVVVNRMELLCDGDSV